MPGLFEDKPVSQCAMSSEIKIEMGRVGGMEVVRGGDEVIAVADFDRYGAFWIW